MYNDSHWLAHKKPRTWENHKYIRIENGRYIYPKDYNRDVERQKVLARKKSTVGLSTEEWNEHYDLERRNKLRISRKKKIGTGTADVAKGDIAYQKKGNIILPIPNQDYIDAIENPYTNPDSPLYNYKFSNVGREETLKSTVLATELKKIADSLPKQYPYETDAAYLRRILPEYHSRAMRDHTFMTSDMRKKQIERYFDWLKELSESDKKPTAHGALKNAMNAQENADREARIKSNREARERGAAERDFNNVLERIVQEYRNNNSVRTKIKKKVSKIVDYFTETNARIAYDANGSISLREDKTGFQKDIETLKETGKSILSKIFRTK